MNIPIKSILRMSIYIISLTMSERWIEVSRVVQSRSITVSGRPRLFSSRLIPLNTVLNTVDINCNVANFTPTFAKRHFEKLYY